AIAVMRKHRLAERLLVDVIGLEWEQVHIEACRWEHVMSEAVERKLVTLLGNPTTSPYGNPIPGLDKLGRGEPAPPAEAGLVRVDDVARRGGGKVEIRRIAEHIQLDPELLATLQSAGVFPGAIVQVNPNTGHSSGVEISGTGAPAQLDSSVAHAVLALGR
ncbi:MAG: iron dependent repressor, metal binding and dimerization domain protein, partial [Sciscionella sp.]